MKIIQLPSRGYPNYCTVRLFSFLLSSPYKTIAFHNTTKGGRVSGRIVIIILLMYNKILYDNMQPNIMVWSSSQMWSWLHPSSVGFIPRKCGSQTTLFLTSKSRCMQKIKSIDALFTTQNVLSWSGRFGGGHTGWSQLQLASSVSPLW